MAEKDMDTFHFFSLFSVDIFPTGLTRRDVEIMYKAQAQPTASVHSYFSGNVVSVDGLLLEEHVQTALVLGQRVTGNSVNEVL